MNQRIPKVSLGLPVYNGESYLDQKLESILAQTFTDFHLIICDNASTDRTQEICQKYAARDNRIHYYRNKTNLGLAPNFNRTFELAPASKYFGWTACDDLVTPDYYQRCVDALDADPTSILAQSWVKLIGPSGEFVANYDPRLFFPHERSEFPSKRFRDSILISHLCLDDLGLIRSSALTMRPLLGSHFGADRNLIAELILKGKFLHIPEFLFFWRDTRGRDLPFDKWSERLDTSKAHVIPMPRWSMFFGYVNSVGRVQMNGKEKVLCYFHIAEWLVRYARGLSKDILRGGAALASRLVKTY